MMLPFRKELNFLNRRINEAEEKADVTLDKASRLGTEIAIRKALLANTQLASLYAEKIVAADTLLKIQAIQAKVDLGERV